MEEKETYKEDKKNSLNHMEDANSFITTAIDKLDSLLEGGIPKGFITLILASPGSGVEIFCKQLATNGEIIYLTTDETVDEVKNTMERFNWQYDNIDFVDLNSKYLDEVIRREEKKLRYNEKINKTKIKELIEMGSEDKNPKNNEEEDYLNIFADILSSSNSKKVIINSLDFFLNQYPKEKILKTLDVAKLRNLKNKGNIFLSMTKGIYGEMFETQMERLADCVLELDVIKKGSNFERMLAVKKMKNYAKKIGLARYKIDDEGFDLENIERII
ncbi:MAG: RAD55 family ATPase [Candidatus Thermoplasmatota archaeon]